MKKIFLVLAVAVLLCVLSISVSAEGIKKFETNELQSGDNITYLEGIDEDMYLSDAGRNNSFYELVDPNFTARAVLENSDGTYTMTFTTTRNWAVIDLYYNNTLLTWNNVTATGNVCSAYGTMNGAANILYWGSDSGLGWCAYDKANDGGETYTLVYNPTANTLVVSYK